MIKPCFRSAAALTTAAALCLLAGCGGTSGTTPATSFPIGGGAAAPTTSPAAPVSTPTAATPAVALIATAGSGGGCVTLTWTASNVPAPTFDVLRVAGSGTTTLASNQTGTRFVDVGLTQNTAYQYQVVAHGTGSVQAISNTGTARAFGPTMAGFGDPPSTAAGPDLLFAGGAFDLATSASSAAAGANYFTLTLTLNRVTQTSDLQSVLYQGTLYDEAMTAGFAKGISVSGNQIVFDSRAAGITLDAQYRPVVQAGFYSLTAIVDGTPLELTAPAGFAGSQPNASTFTDTTGRVFSLTIRNNT